MFLIFFLKKIESTTKMIFSYVSFQQITKRSHGLQNFFVYYLIFFYFISFIF